MNWEDHSNIFFKDELVTFPNCSFFVFREDGIPMFIKSTLAKEIDSNAIGALMGGSWQAARALSSFLPHEENNTGIFRFSFDTSDRGVYILPFSVDDAKFIFGGIFYDEVNPGLMKSRMRQTLEKLNTYVKGVKPSIKKKNEDFLFNDITDQEVDQLFSFKEA